MLCWGMMTGSIELPTCATRTVAGMQENTQNTCAEASLHTARQTSLVLSMDGWNIFHPRDFLAIWNGGGFAGRQCHVYTVTYSK